tara:strand:- start:20 stop:430 length:411 start_codon:yes stop_codon:yes gene_type:complete
MKYIVGILGIFLLSGCIDDQFVSNSLGTSDWQICSREPEWRKTRNLKGAVDEAKENLARGYYIHTSTERFLKAGICLSDTFPEYYYTCARNARQTIERPVEMNANEERRKLAFLEKEYRKQYPRGKQAYDNCMKRQ